MLTRHFLATATLLAFVSQATAQGQTPAPPTAAQQKQEELNVRNALQRLQEAEKNLDKALGQLRQAPVEPGAPPATIAQPTAVSPQGAAIQLAEQALNDVRRAVDEVEIPQQRRQEVLDKLDDADSAMRMARQPDEPEMRRKRLEDALSRVQREVRTTKEEGPAKKAD